MHVKCLLQCLTRGRWSINGSYLAAAAAAAEIIVVVIIVVVTVVIIVHDIENKNMA